MSDNNYKEIWQIAMSQIEEEYNNSNQSQEFKLWFNMKYIEDDNENIKVNVPNEFMWNQMNSKGNVEKIINKIKEISGLNEDIKIIPEIKNELIFSEKENKEKKLNSNNTDKNSNDNLSQNQQNSTLNEKFTFENFITSEGSSSNFAYKVAMSVAENPGKKSNPILFYGGVGLGKTHLMQAIGNEIHKKFGNSKKIKYIQTIDFVNEFTLSLKNKNPEDFKKKFRKLDVLLIDDIQFLTKKDATQQELFYTFEELHNKKAQMVFACDRPLREIENMTERLVSRLGSGICLDLDPPNFETRKAIIYKKLESTNIVLSDDIVEEIAKYIETNVRDLEAAINKIINYAEITNEIITIDLVQKQLKDLYNNPNVGNISISNILKVVSDNYNITIQDIKGKKRDRKFVIPRHIAMYIAKELTEITYSDLGSEFGNRDHTSIMHAVETITEKIKMDSTFKQKINILIKQIKEFKE